MIKIFKPKTPSTIKDRRGQCKLILETKKLESAYKAGKREFQFKSDLYGHQSIKKLLIRYQHGKCAFCEQNIVSVSHGDIEHFRPKAGYRQNKDEKLTKPGYYWLAYEWSNLFLSCQICNQRYKENLFPLRNPTLRALNHKSNLNLERPVFINPGLENPGQYIKFIKEYAKGIDESGRGEKTIEAMGLNRSGQGYDDLLELRRDYLNIVGLTYKISRYVISTDMNQDLIQDIEEAKRLMLEFKSPQKKLSALIVDNYSK